MAMTANRPAVTVPSGDCDDRPAVPGRKSRVGPLVGRLQTDLGKVGQVLHGLPQVRLVQQIAQRDPQHLLFSEEPEAAEKDASSSGFPEQARQAVRKPLPFPGTTARNPGSAQKRRLLSGSLSRKVERNRLAPKTVTRDGKTSRALPGQSERKTAGVSSELDEAFELFNAMSGSAAERAAASSAGRNRG